MDEKLFMRYLPDELYGLIEAGLKDAKGNITEIRLRNMKPVIFTIGGVEYGVKPKGGFTRELHTGITATSLMMKKTVELISGCSLYAWEDEIRAGFITLPGGHRAGICGKVVSEDGIIKTISHISSINMRITHEITGCSDKIMDYAVRPELGHIMIISPPGCGKTTLIRDLARNISDGEKGKRPGITVGIVDERSEIAGSYQGIPQNNVGIRTDVLDRCPKHKGMTMLLRSMAPKVIVADEIGSDEDVKAIADIINAGVKLICSVHGNGLEDIRGRKNIGELISNGLFDKYIVLSRKNGPGTIEGVFDKGFKRVYGE